MKTITKAALCAALALASRQAFAQGAGASPSGGGTEQTNPNPNPTPGSGTDQTAPGSTPDSTRSQGGMTTPGAAGSNGDAQGRRGSGTGAAQNGSRAASDQQVLDGVRSAILQPSAEAEGSVAPDVQNLRVTSRNGKILLRGTVRSEEEKAAIEARASSAAGGVPIQNNLRVK